MGIDVWLTDENETPLNAIADEKGELARIVALASGGSYPLLSGIDPYADTTFNSLQMERFISEWDRLAELAASPRLVDTMVRVRQFAETVQKTPHLYLRFVGD